MSGLDIDTRSDIYGLGVLLYELLVGSTPFDAKELMASGIDGMRKTIREKEPLRPSTKLATLQGEELTTTAKRRSVDRSKLIHQLKGDLDWIVMKCLEKDRTRRYETANGVAADLQRHLDNEPVEAGPPSTIYVLKKFIVRNKWPVMLNATVAGLTFAGLIGTSIGLRRATAARIQADRNAARAGQLADEAKKAEASALNEKTFALRQAYSAGMLSASDALERGQIDTARHYLNNAPAALRGWEWRHLFSRLDMTARVHDRPRSLLSQIHVLPDGRSYYDVGQEPTEGIRRFDIETGQLLATIPIGRFCWHSWLVAGGKQLVAQVSDKVGGPVIVEVWDLERGTRLSAHPVPALFEAAPDGSRVAYEQGQKIHIMDSRSGATRVSPTAVCIASVGQPPIMCFQPNGRRLAVCRSLGQVALVDTDSLEILSAFEPHNNVIQTMVFSGDSRLLATGSLDRTIRVTDVATNPPAAVATLRGHAGWVTRLCFSPDGTLLASWGADRTLRLWDPRTGLLGRVPGQCLWR